MVEKKVEELNLKRGKNYQNLINPTTSRDQEINLKHLEKILKLRKNSRNIEPKNGGNKS